MDNLRFCEAAISFVTSHNLLYSPFYCKVYNEGWKFQQGKLPQGLDYKSLNGLVKMFYNFEFAPKLQMDIFKYCSIVGKIKQLPLG